MSGMNGHKDSSINILIVGGGSRGNAYSQAIAYLARPSWKVVAVAEPDTAKRAVFGKRYIWGVDGREQPADGEAFASWEDFVDWELERRSRNDSTHQPINAVFVCCLDSMHYAAIKALAPLGFHILCEKPLCTSLAHALDLSSALRLAHAQKPAAFSIGHVLRYSPFNMLLRKLVCEDAAIGEIVSMEHTEPIGWWHFPHSYVRGNWRHEFVDSDGKGKVGTLLTKSCHDVDLLMWLLASPCNLTGTRPHHPATITSTGSLSHFKRSRKPKAAGSATNCMHCPLQDEGCAFSAKRFYGGMLKDEHLHWPLNVVVPDIEETVAVGGLDAGQSKLDRALEESYADDIPIAKVRSRNWYGRCVYESDNNVVDSQTVVITWDEDPEEPVTAVRPDSLFGRGPKTAVFHMTYPTTAICERRGHIYGSKGEISYDSHTLSLSIFGQPTQVFAPRGEDIIVGEGHGGGDLGLTKNFLLAVDAIESGSMTADEAQSKYVGCDVDEIVRSHAVVFGAEEARQGKQVVHRQEWWDRKTAKHLIA